MQQQIRKLGNDIGWEIGPGIEEQYYLAFTLNGNINNLEVINDILRNAPPSTNWEFRAGRPRRPFNPRLVFRNERGQTVEVNLEQWEYVLIEFDNGAFFDIEVVSNQVRMDELAQQQAMWIAVQGALGEVDTLAYIDRIYMVHDPDHAWRERSTPFMYLAEHFDGVRKGIR